MTTKTKSAIVKDVKVLLYRDFDSTPLASVSGMASLDQTKADKLIETFILPAADKVMSQAPSWMVRDLSNPLGTGDVEWKGDDADEYAKVGVVKADVLRLLMVMTEGWSTPVTSMTTYDDPLYATYRSPYAGIRPSKSFPAVALGEDYNDNAYLRIECYPKVENKVPTVRAIKASAFSGEQLSVPARCYQSVIYYIASLWYEALGDNSRSELMSREAASMLNIETSDAQ